MLLRKYEYIGSHYFLNDERRQETTQHRVTSNSGLGAGPQHRLLWPRARPTGAEAPGPESKALPAVQLACSISFMPSNSKSSGDPHLLACSLPCPSGPLSQLMQAET